MVTGAEPLNEDGSPPHREAQTVKLEMEDQMVQIKKWHINTPQILWVRPKPAGYILLKMLSSFFIILVEWKEWKVSESWNN